MSIFKCKMCGGALEIKDNVTVATCEYCGTQQTLPRLDDEKKANLYDRANHFRRNNEYDKAMGIYEQILNEDGTDAEAYWSLVLCRYGIEYVEDPASHKRVPTVNRAQFTSVFDDEDYKSALQYADGYQKSIYEEEAKAINEIQKGILEISQKEEPFDVFICYKETDASGRRTPDSVLATELYHELIRDGFKVFFSRITLEDKLGTAYEPYIFAALNSAKVMVVLGTKPECFNAVWVKNEWSRYLALIKNGARKILIPAYKDMDPYDLPEEFSHLQAQDMSKLGFMQDLIRGIQKITKSEQEQKTVVRETVTTVGNTNIGSLLKRAFMFLEDGDWKSANEYCEKVLDIDPECAEAYLGKLMAELQVKKQENLADCDKPFDYSNNYQKAIRFGDDALSATLKGYITHIKERNENNRLTAIYNDAVHLTQGTAREEDYIAAADLFNRISGFKNADALRERCLEKAEVCRKDAIYDSAVAAKEDAGNIIVDYQKAVELFQSIPGWKDADEQMQFCQQRIEELQVIAEEKRLERERQTEIKRQETIKRAKRNKKIISVTVICICVVIVFAITLKTVIIPSSKYNKAMKLYDSGKYNEAIAAFEAVVEFSGDYKDADEMIDECYYQIALDFLDQGKKAQAAIAFGKVNGYNDAKQRSFALWAELANRNTIATGYRHTVALKTDGQVVVAGSNKSGQGNVADWHDIVAVSANCNFTVGLNADGTVVAAGDDSCGQRNVSDWTDIVAISAGDAHTVGLKADGTVVATGANYDGQCDVSQWTDIVSVAAGDNYTIGLKVDGTVLAIGDNTNGRCDVSDWTDIIAISAGDYHAVGLKANGTVVATGYNNDGQCDISGWADIIELSAGSCHTVGLRADGTVVAVGCHYDGRCNTSGWADITSVSAGNEHTVGLKSDGTVLATGNNEYDACNVEYWTNIKMPKNK